MAFDGLIIRNIVKELNNVIINGKIDSIFQPDKYTVLLGFYNKGKNYTLHLSIQAENCRIHLTNFRKANPLVAPNFCMLLRKHLLGGKLVSLTQMDLERVVTFTFETYNDYGEIVNKKLMIETMGKSSNLILTDENDLILGVLKHTNSSRNLCVKNHYTYPISSKVSYLEISDFSEFCKVLEAYHGSIDKAFTGFSRSFVEYASSLFSNDLEKIYFYIEDIIKGKPSKCISILNGKDYTITLGKSNQTFNLFLDEFYHTKEEKELLAQTKNHLLKIILTVLKKYSKRLENINHKLNDTENMDLYRLYGELIITNLYRFSQNTSSITVENYYRNNEPITIPLDSAKTPHQNADFYFKKYNKLKNTLDIVSKQKIETEKELEYLETIVYALENSITLEEVLEIYAEMQESYLFKDLLKDKTSSKTKKKSLQPIIDEQNIDGFKVFVGKNNKQNDYITTKLARPNDIWFHTQKIHGSHVLLKTENKAVPKDVLLQCATLAAQNSRAKNSSHVPVDYTLAKYVKKPSGSKAGQVIYTNQKTIII